MYKRGRPKFRLNSFAFHWLITLETGFHDHHRGIIHGGNSFSKIARSSYSASQRPRVRLTACGFESEIWSRAF